MTFDEMLSQVQALLEREQRVSYRGLKRRFALDDEYLDDLKEELIGAKRLATDEEGRFLVWTGGKETAIAPSNLAAHQSPAPSTESRPAEAERRQLTVMFCDLVGSTALSTQLDPEELREVVHAYQETCTEVIHRYDGYIAQHLGDGLLIYFGYPTAHEDDAQRAIRVGLGILAELQDLRRRVRHLIQVRIGIHTGLVVVGEIGSGNKRETLALGETPNLAARIQALAEPDTLAISAVTQRLTGGLFTYQSLGLHQPKGFSTPLEVYRVVGSGTQSRFDAALTAGLTPLIGRSEELALLWRLWEQAKAGDGQVILLGGDPGMGKSRLVRELKERISRENAPRIEFSCSPYHQNSAFFPIIEHLQRVVGFQREDTPQTKLTKLQHTLAAYRFPKADTLPLFAALLSVPYPDSMPPLTLTPQKQKQKSQEALVAWIVEEAEQTAVYCAWEDLHWADPSTLEVLSLYLDQVPTTRQLVLLTFRPDFTPPWGPRSYFTSLTLKPLGQQQVETMVEQVTGGTGLPAEVAQQIVARTDGVPLFVEELTKTVVEAIGAHGGASPHSLNIPATLQDSLMARLDRLGPAKEVAQLGAMLGREFSHELCQAVSSTEETSLQLALAKLVAAEVLYQRGAPPNTRYLFKHALIQDIAYQSLLKSKRQQFHQRIAQVLEAQFPDIIETQPEFLAHHYTEARLSEQAVPYWDQAGQGAIRRAAFSEGLNHLTNGLNLLQTLPESNARNRQELGLQSALGLVLQTIKGYAAPEVDHAYIRARQLCQQVGDTAQLISVLRGQLLFYGVRADYRTALELGQQMLAVAEREREPAYQVEAQLAMGLTALYMGELSLSRTHLEHNVAIDTPQGHSLQAFQYLGHSQAMSFSYLGRTLWLLGYPDQALQRSQEGLSLAQTLALPMTVAQAQGMHTLLYQVRRESELTQEWAERTIAYASEHGFPYWLTLCTMVRGWLLDHHGQSDVGGALFSRGLTGYRGTGARLGLSWLLALSAETAGKNGQSKEALEIMAEALAYINHSDERYYEAEVYRLKGELLLMQEGKNQKELAVPSSQRLPSNAQAQAKAEACFHKAIEIARTQQAKSWELRAATSLARLWQQQGRYGDARELLATVYGWFSEGFATPDLQEAQALLKQLS